MYENITYAELKKLPKEQKAEAWKELLSTNPVKKQLAEKLGVSPAIVYNMVSRYVDGKPLGTEAVEPTALKKTNNLESEVVSTKRRTRTAKQVNNTGNTEEVGLKPSKIIKNTSKEEAEAGNVSFSIAVNKIVSGEDARFFLNGIGGTLQNNQKYCIEVKITEKR